MYTTTPPQISPSLSQQDLALLRNTFVGNQTPILPPSPHASSSQPPPVPYSQPIYSQPMVVTPQPVLVASQPLVSSQPIYSSPPVMTYSSQPPPSSQPITYSQPTYSQPPPSTQPPPPSSQPSSSSFDAVLRRGSFNSAVQIDPWGRPILPSASSSSSSSSSSSAATARRNLEKWRALMKSLYVHDIIGLCLFFSFFFFFPKLMHVLQGILVKQGNAEEK